MITSPRGDFRSGSLLPSYIDTLGTSAPARDGQCLTCRKSTLPAILRPHLHSRMTSACFCARGMGLPSAVSEMPYSPISHFLVGGSIRERLISFPCFRQKSSNDLSVTNVSSSLRCPAAIKL